MSNQSHWQSNALVTAYSNIKTYLQPPEQAIFETLKEELKHYKMLDIGIGTGRTTTFFAPKVKEYVGVDYSQPMVEHCKNHFAGNSQYSFSLADVRDLSEFDNDSFDFVLFSFNGIDCIPHEDRIIGFKEIQRVLKKDGIFVFSAHNLNGIDRLDVVNYQFSWHPIKFFKNSIKHGLFWLLNPSRNNLKKRNWAIIRDGAFKFRLDMYYIKPLVQIQQLKNLGFNNIQPYALDTGIPMNEEEVQSNKEPWVYYLCQKVVDKVVKKPLGNEQKIRQTNISILT